MNAAPERHAFTVRSSRTAYVGRIMALRVDEASMPGGGSAVREVIEHPGAVAVAAVDDEERIVLVHQYRHPVRQTLWELPAGLVDVEGERLVDAAARELAEEADLVAARWDLLATVHTSPGCSDEKIRLFLARGLSPVPHERRHQRTHEEAEMQLRWVELDEAVAMALSGEITNAACLVGVLGTAHARDRGWATLRPAGEAS